LSKLALVTGASSGIGRAYAEELGSRGFDLIVVGRRRERLEELEAVSASVAIESIVADLATDDGIAAVAEVAGSRRLTMLVNNAGVAHYMPFVELPPDKAAELIHVKELAPTLIARAALPGMLERREGTIINVAGMIAFSGPAGPEQMPRRAVYAGTLAHSLVWTQQLHAELASEGLRVQVVCPGVVATEFHTRQGMDLSAVPRMSAEEVVAASLRSLELGEVVCAPGVERADLLQAVFDANLAVFGAQSPSVAERYGATSD
jgi:uncharacterized protein